MSPVVVEAEVDINRPPEQVFDYCSDPGREPEWNPMMKACKKITGGSLGVGSRYAAEFVKGPPMVMECVGYERPSAWSLIGNSSALTAGGGGRVLPAHGLLRLAAPLLRRRMKPMLGRDLANIKSVLERSQGREPGSSSRSAGT
jgi:hypothetical protein